MLNLAFQCNAHFYLIEEEKISFFGYLLTKMKKASLLYILKFIKMFILMSPYISTNVANNDKFRYIYYPARNQQYLFSNVIVQSHRPV